MCFLCSDGFFFAVKEVSLLDQGSQAKQSISQLEQVRQDILLSWYKFDSPHIYYFYILQVL